MLPAGFVGGRPALLLLCTRAETNKPGSSIRNGHIRRIRHMRRIRRWQAISRKCTRSGAHALVATSWDAMSTLQRAPGMAPFVGSNVGRRDHRTRKQRKGTNGAPIARIAWGEAEPNKSVFGVQCSHHVILHVIFHVIFHIISHAILRVISPTRGRRCIAVLHANRRFEAASGCG